MPNIGVYLPDALDQRLRRLKERGIEVPVSTICQKGLEAAVEAEEAALRGDRMARLVARLSRTRTAAEQAEADGRAAGRRWAEDAAAYSELEAVKHFRDWIQEDPDNREIVTNVAPVENGRTAKTISAETHFGHPVDRRDELDMALAGLVHRGAERLIVEEARARSVYVKLQLADRRAFSRQITRTTPTDDEDELLASARAALRKSYVEGTGVKLLGVGLSRLAMGDTTIRGFDRAVEDGGSDDWTFNLPDSALGDVLREHPQYSDAAIEGFLAGASEVLAAVQSHWRLERAVQIAANWSGAIKPRVRRGQAPQPSRAAGELDAPAAEHRNPDEHPS